MKKPWKHDKYVASKLGHVGTSQWPHTPARGPQLCLMRALRSGLSVTSHQTFRSMLSDSMATQCSQFSMQRNTKKKENQLGKLTEGQLINKFRVLPELSPLLPTLKIHWQVGKKRMQENKSLPFSTWGKQSEALEGIWNLIQCSYISVV